MFALKLFKDDSVPKSEKCWNIIVESSFEQNSCRCWKINAAWARGTKIKYLKLISRRT